MVLDASAQVLLVQGRAVTADALDCGPIQDVGEPAAMLIGSANANVLDAVVQACPRHASRPWCVIDDECSTCLLQERFVPRQWLSLIPTERMPTSFDIEDPRGGAGASPRHDCSVLPGHRGQRSQ